MRTRRTADLCVRINRRGNISCNCERAEHMDAFLGDAPDVFAKVAGRTSAWGTSLILHIIAACAAMATAEYVTGGVNFVVACG